MTTDERFKSQGFIPSGKTWTDEHGNVLPEYVATESTIKSPVNLKPGDIIKVGRKWAIVT